MRLDEKYRPKSLDDVAGQDKVVGIVKRLADGPGLGGRAYWITGKSGTGKTTIARIMAKLVTGGSFFDSVEVVGRELTLRKLAEITESWMYCGGHALIVNEAHGLAKPTIEKLLDVLENLRDRVIVIFTTTRSGADLFEEQLDSIPFGSRCVQLPLAIRGSVKPMAERLKWIASQEGLGGKPVEAYATFLNSEGMQCNMRKALWCGEKAEVICPTP
jgi:hypothetical protein